MTDTYVVLARDIGAPMPHHAAYLEAAHRAEREYVGVVSPPWLFEYHNRAVRFCAPAEGIRRVSEATLEKFANPAFLNRVTTKQRETAAGLLAFARTLKTRSFDGVAPSELASQFRALYDRFVSMNAWGHLANMTDYEHELLSTKVLELLTAAVARTTNAASAAEAFSLLTTPHEVSGVQQSERAFYELLALIQRAPDGQPFERADVVQAMKQYLDQYDWLQFHYDGPTISKQADIVELLESELRQGTSGRERVRSMDDDRRSLPDRQTQLAIALALSKEDRHWVAVARTCLFLKGLRKDAVYEASRCAEPLYRAIGRALTLSRGQVRHLTTDELVAALEGGEPVDADLVNERIKFSVLQLRDGHPWFATGEVAAQESAKIVEATAGNPNELRGTSAFPGSARGTVRIIASAQEMTKMLEGDILVAPSTNPNVLPAMKKAAAIITDVGGVTCHAAIVSRELKIPCVIGTKVATLTLKDGDAVEVDATKGIVRRVQ